MKEKKGGIAVGPVGSIAGTHHPLDVGVPEDNPHAYANPEGAGKSPSSNPRPPKRAKDSNRRKRNIGRG